MESPSASPQTHAPTNGSSFRNPSRCSQCTRQQGHGRNLVVCIDGTSNQFGQNNTNVVKLFAKIDLETKNPEQFAYYSSGIGTRPKSLHIFNRMERAVSDKFDMAVAWNMEEIVKDAYGWLAREYHEGDQIYLFGFSRGAYQVRVLAGMIHEIGLIRTPTEKQIGTAYDHFESIRSGKPKTRQIAREFKNTFSWKDLRVHFVGVWDTVSSVGIIRGDVFLSTSSSAAHACHFRHALALDELRVKFMPEYFHEMNSQTDGGKSKYVVSADAAASPPSERPQSKVSDNGTHSSEGKKSGEIKEVWFAGSHSDVGGKNRPGKSQQAGNVSLLWMRREATASGLVLEPTDIVWVPDDLDLGTSNSMAGLWPAVEYMPIKHQVSFSGAGEDSRRLHKLQPRRIIPGQKVHASVLYANAYKPKATLGEGFDIPIIQSGVDDAELDSQIWETGLFDDTAAQELLKYLGSQQGVAPIYLDRLLFMLRFKEGKQCVRNVPQWRDQFMHLIHNRECAALVRLVIIVAYYEASCDPEAPPKSRVQPYADLPQETFDYAKQSLSNILKAHKHRDGPRVVALLRPLTQHPILREQILTPDVLEILVELLDAIIKQPKGNFGQAMDGLNCLLQCKDTRPTLVEKLGANPSGSDVSRLSWILEVEDPHHLTAALRMVLTLARIPDQRARAVCSFVKPRIRELASKDGRLVGPLAVEVLLALYDPNDRDHQLNIRNAHVRANLASALIRLNPDRHDSADGQAPNEDPEQQVLRRLFGLGADALSDPQRRLIRELKKAVQKGNVRERTAATLTLLKLCETKAIRDYLLEIHLLNVLVSQLRRKDSALLAAYALAICLRNYSDMKESMKDNENLPKHIVGMLRLDYFDDAVGPVEGFQIFGDFMQHADLREKIKDYDITEVLKMKLGNGKPKEIRTSLICLDIFRSFDADGPWTRELVAKSLERLRDPIWKVQKAGVAILSALAQTAHGVATIDPHIPEIVGMLLPESYRPISTSASGPTFTSSDSSEGQTPPADLAVAQSPTLLNAPSRPPSWMMGPACALRILAQSDTLRASTHNAQEYDTLKNLYLTGTLVDEADTSPWRVWTPNRTDVITMLDKMIKAVDGELSEQGLLSIGDAVLPHIRHWNRLVTLLRNQAVGVITILPALLGISVLAILAVAVVTPIYLSSKLYDVLKLLFVRWQDTRILNRLRGDADGDDDDDDDQDGSNPEPRADKDAPSEPMAEPGPSGAQGHGGNTSQSVQDVETARIEKGKQPRRHESENASGGHVGEELLGGLGHGGETSQGDEMAHIEKGKQPRRPESENTSSGHVGEGPLGGLGHGGETSQGVGTVLFEGGSGKGKQPRHQRTKST